MIIALVWAGIPLGGSLAALYSFAFAHAGGWKAIFILGGVLPLPAALLAYGALRGSHAGASNAVAAAHAKIIKLFVHGEAPRTLVTAAMFFFGYVTTSIIAYWLPTILSHRAASPFMILVTFGALNVGGVLGTLALGFIASRAHSRHLLSIAWAAAGVCGLGAAVAGLGTDSIAVLAIGGSTIGAAAQALSVALANAMHREWGLEATSVGFMSGAGRIGQMCALSVSGTVIAFGGRETLLLGMAGVCACIAALLSLLPARPSPTKPAERPAF